MVYKKTIEWILLSESHDALFNFEGNDGEIYISIVDALFQKYDESELTDLSHPSLELQYKNRKINLSDSIYVRIQNSLKEFIYNDEIIKINKEYLNHAPCALKDLTIRITGTLEYIDCNDIDKKFDIRMIEDNLISKKI
jgi:hypothetical protein